MRGSCLILGAGPLLGHALARRFGRAGHPVALVARSSAGLGRRVDDLRAEGISAVGFPGDLSEPEAVATLVDAARDRLGPAEVLIYNAAALGVEALPSELSVALLEQTLRVNVVGALVAAQRCLPDMVARGAGTILLTGGTYAIRPAAIHSSIGMGKAALRNLTFSLAEEVGPAGVHVATVTISGVIGPGTRFAPATIADLYWDLHRQPRPHWDTEVRY